MTNTKATSAAPLKSFKVDDDVGGQEIFTMAIPVADDAIDHYFENDGVRVLEKLPYINFILPQSIFADVNMLRMNWACCLGEIQQISRAQKKTGFVFSTSATPTMATQTTALGAIEYIVKRPGTNYSIQKISLP